jgi:hypothetical protein
MSTGKWVKGFLSAGTYPNIMHWSLSGVPLNIRRAVGTAGYYLIGVDGVIAGPFYELDTAKVHCLVKARAEGWL